MTNLKLMFVLLLTTCFIACSDTETTEADSEIAGENGVMSVSLTNSNDASSFIITQGTSAVIAVTLVDENSDAIANQTINFTSSQGTVSSSARLTNQNGETEFIVDTTDVNSGVVTTTISTTIDSETLTDEFQFEVIGATTVTDPAIEEGFNVSIALFNDTGLNTNTLTTESTAQLQLTLTDDDDNPIANIPVSFTAELGTLQAPSALTDSNGVASVVLDTGTTLGAGFVSASVVIDSVTQTPSFAYQIIAGVSVDSINLGYLDDTETFIADQIKTSQTNEDGLSVINAGATLGLEFSIVDDAFELLDEAITASFTSFCVDAGKATIDSAVSARKGTFRATYQDLSCAGASGNEDTIVASITVNSKNYTISHDLQMLPEGLGAIEFVSASPETIVIKGTGGQGQQEIATVTFIVKGELGNPIEQQTVAFDLSTQAGGIELTSESGITNSEGLVTAVVKSGSVPTAVRVNASVTTSDGVNIKSQSDLLSINTGLPDQNSITIAFSEINPEARNIVGKQITVSAYLADSFNNPIVDGTVVNFTTEGGSIEPSCQTFGGYCSVKWTSQEPYVDNHRVTILATALGHESFIDVNGNNIMDDSDGTAANDTINNVAIVEAGFSRPEPAITAGYLDMQEAWRDDNENYAFDAGEVFYDFNDDNMHSDKDNLFNGPQCDSAVLCPATADNMIHIRKAAVLITASSKALLQVTQLSDDLVLVENYDDFTVNDASDVARGEISAYSLKVSDTAMQTMPLGTQVSVTASLGELTGDTQISVANTIGVNDPNGFGGMDLIFYLENNQATPLTDEEDDDAASVDSTATINVVVTSPSGIITSTSFKVTLL